MSIAAEDIEQKGAKAVLAGVGGILVPGGFGGRGVEGKILAVRYARENNVPYFGICYGMHMAVIEFARNVLKLENADTTENVPEAKNPVIHLMEEQKRIMNLGGTMRLGAFPCDLRKGSLVRKIYGKDAISERHRHRYEFNNDYREQFEEAGMQLSGQSPNGILVEIVELRNHPWFIGVQFHPEFKSRPIDPHPLFREFVAASLKNSKL
jgi:CTP synthase